MPANGADPTFRFSLRNVIQDCANVVDPVEMLRLEQTRSQADDGIPIQ
jgi:hypothetical protein